MKHRNPLIYYTILCLHVPGFSPMKTNIFSVLRALWSTLAYSIVMIWLLLELFLNFQGYSTLTRAIGLFPVLLSVSVKMYFLTAYKQNIKKMVLKTGIELAGSYPDSVTAIGKANMNQVYKVFKLYNLGLLFTFLQMSSQAFYTKTPIILTYKEQEMTSSYWNLVFFVDMNFLISSTLFYNGYNWLFLYFSAHIVSEMKVLKAAVRYLLHEVDSGKLRILVDHHNHVLSIVEDINHNYSPILLMEYTLSFLSICFSLFCMTMDGFPPDGEHIMRYGILAVNFMVSMAFFSYAGDVLTAQCEKISTTFFYEIMKKPLNKKSEFMSFMIIGRSQKRTNISIGGFCGLNMETFYLAMRKCLSFLTFIQALRERGHNSY